MRPDDIVRVDKKGRVFEAQVLAKRKSEQRAIGLAARSLGAII